MGKAIWSQGSRLRGLFRYKGALALLTLTAGVALLPGGSFAAPISGAAFTTVNETVDGTGHCQNGNPSINCNIYDGKQYVWLNGGPLAAQPGDGTYFFAVLSPGGQPDPNDGAPLKANGDDPNLSDEFDAYGNRTFSLNGGVITYSGSRDFANNKIRLLPYADTPNPGGVYILAICSLANGYPVTPKSCKYDAFKVKPTVPPPAQGLTGYKDATPSFDRTFHWNITKAVDKTRVNLLHAGDTATFTYTVTVTHDSGVDGNWAVDGTITVINSNENDAVTGVDITDSINDANAACVVTDGTSQTIPADSSSTFGYSCTYSAAPSSSNETNSALVTWPDQDLATDGHLAGGTATFTFPVSWATPTNLIDDCVNVTDTYAGTLGSVCSTDPSPTALTYSRTIPAPTAPPLCVSYPNTATFTTNTSGTTGSASRTVMVCRVPPSTGALTMGFWQNKNGQGIISRYCGGTSGASLYSFLRSYNPFKDLASSTCAGEGAYVYAVIKVATCGGSTCNAMLKAQMLATALDVYFSDPSLGGNRIGAPAAIGGLDIDLTLVCQMIDGSGGATCPGSYENASSAFGGATHLTVSQLLAYAASQSNVGGSSWYGQIKATQVLAKDTFDAINNQVAFLF
jgi:hypothetical protein